MSIVKVIGFVILLTSPHVFAGMMTLDMEDFTYWDNYGFLQTGGRLSLTIRTDGVDESTDGEKGFYTGVITGGNFYNAASQRDYNFDISGKNWLLIDLSKNFFTSLRVCGFFSHVDGNHMEFDLSLEGTLKKDDRLDDLADTVSFFNNEVRLVTNGDDSFQGHAPKNMKLAKSVPEPPGVLLLGLGVLGLGMSWLRRRKVL